MADLEARIKSFDVLIDCTKQMITLSTGFIALTITFQKNFLGTDNHAQSATLGLAWISFILCIGVGLSIFTWVGATLGDMAGSRELKLFEKPSLRTRWNVQVILFFIGVALSIAYGFTSLY